jgi:hypothetical protein
MQIFMAMALKIENGQILNSRKIYRVFRKKPEFGRFFHVFLGKHTICYIEHSLCVTWNTHYVLHGTLMMCYMEHSRCVTSNTHYMLHGTLTMCYNFIKNDPIRANFMRRIDCAYF